MKISTLKNGIFFAFFLKIELNMRFHCYNPEEHFLAQKRVVWLLSIKIHAGVSAVGDWKEQENSENLEK